MTGDGAAAPYGVCIQELGKSLFILTSMLSHADPLPAAAINIDSVCSVVSLPAVFVELGSQCLRGYDHFVPDLDKLLSRIGWGTEQSKEGTSFSSQVRLGLPDSAAQSILGEIIGSADDFFLHCRIFRILSCG